MSFPAYVTEKHNTDHFVDTFATYNTGEETSRYAASKGLSYGGGTVQKWNLGLRVVTFLCALAAVLSTIFAKQTDHYGWTMEYTSSSAFVFFMIVNAVVAVYAFVQACIAVFMLINGSGQSCPGKLIFITLIFNLIGVVFLLLAFASAMATEVISHNGFYAFADDTYTVNLEAGICDTFGTFCTVIEVALGFCGVAIITFLAGTTLDGYYLHLRGM
ncbi:unnamed protein product [Calypogeia fissa]